MNVGEPRAGELNPQLGKVCIGLLFAAAGYILQPFSAQASLQHLNSESINVRGFTSHRDLISDGKDRGTGGCMTKS